MLGPGRIRAGLQVLLLEAGLYRPTLPASVETAAPQRVQPFDKGVFEIEIRGYRAHVFLNGEPVLEYPTGVSSRRSDSAPVTFKPGRNILAVRYSALEGAVEKEMVLRVFRWNSYNFV